jgi:DNA-binding response OmpR family regulator
MKVLVAEDDMYIREGLVELLEQEGYEVSAAENGQIAFQLYQQESYSLILLDIMMPELDGYSLCKLIRKENDNVAIIFITAKSEEIDQVLGLELGADDYIFKPFGTREVIARIRAVTRRYIKQINQEIKNYTAEERLATEIHMGDLILKPDELKAWRGDQVFDLSLRDCKILKVLAENRGKVVDRDTLFNYCWGRDYMPTSRTLDQYISKLRKIIELDHKEPKIIKTVHGAGYRFDG